MSIKPVSYLQTDPKWANVSYSAKGESTTIGKSGCGPTAMSMVLATLCDKNVTPKTECAWALAHGYKAPHQGTYYGYFVPAAKRYGLVCKQLNGATIYGNSASKYHAQAKAAIDNGDLVIACMGKGNWTSSGHYVLVWNISGNVIYINDPASTKLARTQGSYSLFKSQVKYYWIIQVPDKFKQAAPTENAVDYSVKVEDKTGLNCRTGAGTEYSILTSYPLDTVIHITKESSNGWGYTGTGWICLANTSKVEPREEEEVVTLKDFKELYAQMRAELQDNDSSEYSEAAREWAKETGIVTGGSSDKFNGMWEDVLTREQMVTMLYRFATYIGKI